MNTESVLTLLKSTLKRQWYFVAAFVVAAVIFVGALMGVALFTDRVTIIDGESVITVSTTEKTADAILKKTEISISKDDKISFAGIQNNEGTITIKRAFPVTIKADGGTFTVSMTDGTVSEALKKAGVSLFSDDIISVPATAAVAKNTAIGIKRVTRVKSATEAAIPFEQTTVPAPNLKKGKTKLKTEGVKGLSRTITENTLVDGKLIDSKVVETLTVKEPVAEVVAVGTAIRSAVSPLEIPESLKFDDKGVPLNYSKVYTGKSAGYSARPGAKTASGRTAQVGYVAVDPKLIPYGTKLYIASTDGKHVYGYAVAADTGTALLDGRILVDLFFGSYEDSCDWAVKQVNVFVLN